MVERFLLLLIMEVVKIDECESLVVTTEKEHVVVTWWALGANG